MEINVNLITIWSLNPNMFSLLLWSLGLGECLQGRELHRKQSECSLTLHSSKSWLDWNTFVDNIWCCVRSKGEDKESTDLRSIHDDFFSKQFLTVVLFLHSEEVVMKSPRLSCCWRKLGGSQRSLLLGAAWSWSTTYMSELDFTLKEDGTDEYSSQWLLEHNLESGAMMESFELLVTVFYKHSDKERKFQGVWPLRLSVKRTFLAYDFNGVCQKTFKETTRRIWLYSQFSL